MRGNITPLSSVTGNEVLVACKVAFKLAFKGNCETGRRGEGLAETLVNLKSTRAK